MLFGANQNTTFIVLCPLTTSCPHRILRKREVSRVLWVNLAWFVKRLVSKANELPHSLVFAFFFPITYLNVRISLPTWNFSCLWGNYFVQKRARKRFCRPDFEMSLGNLGIHSSLWKIELLSSENYAHLLEMYTRAFVEALKKPTSNWISLSPSCWKKCRASRKPLAGRG